jgi:glutamine amidotransferase
MKIVIIKYNAGNIQSVLFALERIGTEALVTDNPEIIRSADKVIFPGLVKRVQRWPTCVKEIWIY